MSDLNSSEVGRLEAATAGLIEFARGSRADGGFGWLDDDGTLDATEGVQTWITCRMTHCFALAVLRGDDAARPLLGHGVEALLGPLRDAEHDGWHSRLDGGSPTSSVKEGYAHAFVLLAATSALAAGHPRAEELFDAARTVIDDRFWREDDGMILDVWNRDWTELDPYRGVNANMHAVEAFLAAAEVSGERVWLDRALRILGRVLRLAEAYDERLPEHFDERWRPIADYNIEEPGHPFRPYGVTIGHLFEWARLALHAETLLGQEAPAWLRERAVALHTAAAQRGWEVDGAEGFVYTTDFADVPVVRERMHWVATEAIAAAWTLYRATGEEVYRQQYDAWWEYADAYLVDHRRGSWHHELDADNHPSARVWRGKPDIYHAYQAALLPLLPPSASFAGGARAAREAVAR